MSVVTNQPLPFGRLEREKHIRMIFRAFQNRCETSCECHTHSPGSRPCQTPPGRQSTERLGPVVTNTHTEAQGRLKTEEEECRWSLKILDTVSQIHITARTELQGPQCVPQRIYGISAGVSRSQLFVAVEESSCLCLQCCGPARACSLQGFDRQGRQVFYFERPFRMDACCFGCCLMELSAYTPQKQLIGTVCQRWSMFTPLIEIKDTEGASAIRIQGPCCPNRCFSDQQFKIVSNIGENIGTIWKKWPGFNNECNMDHEYFGLDVPVAMKSQTKLLLLAATFLMNHMFFEMS